MGSKNYGEQMPVKNTNYTGRGHSNLLNGKAFWYDDTGIVVFFLPYIPHTCKTAQPDLSNTIKRLPQVLSDLPFWLISSMN